MRKKNRPILNIDSELNKLIPLATELTELNTPIYFTPVSAGYPSGAYNYIENSIHLDQCGFVNIRSLLFLGIPILTNSIHTPFYVSENSSRTRSPPTKNLHSLLQDIIGIYLPPFRLFLLLA